jgi:hypothetical protein
LLQNRSSDGVGWCSADSDGEYLFASVAGPHALRYSSPIDVCDAWVGFSRKGDTVTIRIDHSHERGPMGLSYIDDVGYQLFEYHIDTGFLVLREPSWMISAPTVVDRVTQHEIDLLLEEHDPEALQVCHRSFFDRVPGLSSTETLVLRVARDGHVESSELEALRARPMVTRNACVAKLAKGWTFPSSGAVTILSVPIFIQ